MHLLCVYYILFYVLFVCFTQNLALGAFVAVGCSFCRQVQLLPSGVIFAVRCNIWRRMLLLSPGATFVLGAAFVLGCYFCPRVLAYLLGECMTCAFY